LAPHYEEAATALKAKTAVKLAKVDCVDQADLCNANGIQGYPTLRVYRKGDYTEYTGPRKADGIIAYMTKCVDTYALSRTPLTIKSPTGKRFPLCLT